jgi:DNA primase
MAGLIPQDFIDQVLARSDIIDVINARVPLKKHGREYQACCPFHNEKTPSFTVSPTKQFYYCFGCGVSGSSITFLMEYEHLDFVEAVESLASSMGMQVPRQEAKQRSPLQQKQRKGLEELMEEAARYYQQQLKKAPAAVDYLKQRGLSGEIAQTFSLGYSHPSWDAVIKYLGRNYSPQQIIDSGLAISKDNGGSYDRYRDRIMFPIRNRKGQVIGFGGRVMGDDTPKYINSPETQLFHKGNELYGLYEARNATRKLDRVIVVEGYMDVISLAQYGISYAVATLGTATTRQHIEMLYRTVPEIIFCFDGDRAGKEAAWRALENALPVLRDEKEIRFLFLPEGEDPDTLVRRIGQEAFESGYAEASSLSSYFIEGLSSRFNISSNEGKARFLTEAGGLLKQVPESLLKDQLIANLSRLTGVERRSILRGQGAVPEAVRSQPQRSNPGSRRQVQRTPIKYAITLILSQPSLVSLVENPEQIALSGLPGADLLATLIESIEESPHINAVSLLERWRYTDLEAPLLQLMKLQPGSDDDEVLKQEFQDCLRYIRTQANQRRLENLLHKARNDGLSEQEKNDVNFLLRQNETV